MKLVSKVLVTGQKQGGQVGELLCVIELGVPERCFVHCVIITNFKIRMRDL